MKITKDNLHQAISALRECAKQHSNDLVGFGGIITSNLCNDVADYLEKQIK